MSEKESTTFHNEDVVFRIAMWSNIVSWIALALSLLTFSSTMYSIISNWAMVSQSLPMILLKGERSHLYHGKHGMPCQNEVHLRKLDP